MKIDKTIRGRRFYIIKYMSNPDETLWGIDVALTSSYIHLIIHYGLLSVSFETYRID